VAVADDWTASASPLLSGTTSGRRLPSPGQPEPADLAGVVATIIGSSAQDPVRAGVREHAGGRLPAIRVKPGLGLGFEQPRLDDARAVDSLGRY
jgi:hypothetical protein